MTKYEFWPKLMFSINFLNENWEMIASFLFVGLGKSFEFNPPAMNIKSPTIIVVYLNKNLAPSLIKGQRQLPHSL